MKFSDLLLMSSSSLWKRKVRTILTVLGVVVGTASIVVMISFGLGLNRATMADIEKYGGLTTITVMEKGSYGYYEEGGSSSDDKTEIVHLSDDVIKQLSELPHVKSIYPTISIGILAKCGRYESYINLNGVDMQMLRDKNLSFAQGALPEADATELQMIYGNTVLADFSDPKTGAGYYMNGELPDIDLMTDSIMYIFDMDRYYQSQSGGENGEVVKPPKKHIVPTAALMAGSVEEYSQDSYMVYCDINQLKTILKKEFKNKAIPGQPTTASGKPLKEIYYSSIVVNVDGIDNVSDLQNQIKELGFDAQSNAEWVESTQDQLGYIQLILGGIGAVSLFVAAIGITNTMMMSIYERTKEIGVMKVLGCDLRNIQALFLIEAGYIGLIGGVIGLMLSYIVSAIANVIVKSMGTMEGGLSYIPAWLALISILFAVIVGMVAGFFPSLRAMRLSALAAIRNE